MEDKEKLNRTIRALKEKLVSQDRDLQRAKQELEELQEHGEIMEFQKLELEEHCEKLSEQLNSSSCSDSGIRLSPATGFSESPIFSDTHVVLSSDLSGLMETVDVAEVCDKLTSLIMNQKENLSPEERLSLINQSVTTLQTLKKQTEQWQEECQAARLASQVLPDEISPHTTLCTPGASNQTPHTASKGLQTDFGEHAELVLEYEAIRNDYLSAKNEIVSLQEELHSSSSRETVLKYQIDHLNQLEQRYNKQIQVLKRRLSDFTQGREFESEILNEKIVQARKALLRAEQAETEAEALRDRLRELQELAKNCDIEQTLRVQPSAADRLKLLAESQLDPAPSDRDKPEGELAAAERLILLAEPRVETVGGAVNGVICTDTRASQTDEMDQVITTDVTKSPDSSDQHPSVVKALEQADVESSTTILKLLDTKAELNNKIKLLEAQLRRERRGSVTSSSSIVNGAHGAGHTENKSVDTELTGAAVASMQDEIYTLRDQLNEALEDKGVEKESRSMLKQMESLEEQVHKMAENEVRLGETIRELEEVEVGLRKKVQDQERENEVLKASELQLARLLESEENLKNRLEQMATNETILRQELSEALQSKSVPKQQGSHAEVSLVEKTVQTVTVGEQLDMQAEFLVHLCALAESLVSKEFSEELLGTTSEETAVYSALSSCLAKCPTQEVQSQPNHLCSDSLVNLKSLYEKLKLLQEKLKSLSLDNKTMHDHLEGLPKSFKTVKELVNHIEKLTTDDTVKEQKLRKLQCDLVGAQESKDTEVKLWREKLESERTNSERCEAKLREKLEVLENSEDRLMEQVGALEDENERLLTILEKQKSNSFVNSSLQNGFSDNETRISKSTSVAVSNGVPQHEHAVNDERKSNKTAANVSNDLESVATLTADENKYIEEINILKAELAKVGDHKKEQTSTSDTEAEAKLRHLEEKIDLLTLSEEKLLESASTHEEEAEQLKIELKEAEQLHALLREDNISLQGRIEQLSEQLRLTSVSSVSSDLTCTTVACQCDLLDAETMKDLSCENQLLLQDVEAHKDTIRILEKKLVLNSPKDETSRSTIKHLKQQNTQLLETLRTISSDLQMDNFHHPKVTSSVPEEGTPSRVHVNGDTESPAVKASSFKVLQALCCCPGAPTWPSVCDLTSLSTEQLVTQVMELHRVQMHQCLQLQKLLKVLNQLQHALYVVSDMVYNEPTAQEDASRSHHYNNLKIIELETELEDCRENLKEKTEGYNTLLAQNQIWFSKERDELVKSSSMVLEEAPGSSEEHLVHLQDSLHCLLHLLQVQLDWEQHRCREVQHQALKDVCCLAFQKLTHRQEVVGEVAADATTQDTSETSLQKINSQSLHRQIKDLFQLEAFQRQQILDLEAKCQEHHKLRCQDQTSLHELSIEMEQRKLQEASLESQLSRCDAREQELILELDKLRFERDDLGSSLQLIQSQEQDQHRQLTAAQKSLTDSQVHIQALQHEASVSHGQLEKTEALASSTQQVLHEKVERQSELLEDLESKLLELQHQLKKQQDENKLLQAENSDVKEAQETAIAEVTESQQLAAAGQERANELELQLHRARQTESALHEQISATETREKQVKARVTKLEGQLKEALAINQEHKNEMIYARINQQSQVMIPERKEDQEADGHILCEHEEDLQELDHLRTNYSHIQETLDLLRENYEDAKLQLSIVQSQLYQQESQGEHQLWSSVEHRPEGGYRNMDEVFPQGETESLGASVTLDLEESSLVTPPPLPLTTPPAPDHMDPGSVDEVSELDEDEHAFTQLGKRLRIRSVEHAPIWHYGINNKHRRSSVEPEMMCTSIKARNQPAKPARISRSEERFMQYPLSVPVTQVPQRSLDSLADDSGFQDPRAQSKEHETTREGKKIAHLERQLRAARMTAGNQSELIQQLKDKVQLIEKTGPRSKYFLEELERKDRKITGLQLKCELFEKTRDQPCHNCQNLPAHYSPASFEENLRAEHVARETHKVSVGTQTQSNTLKEAGMTQATQTSHPTHHESHPHLHKNHTQLHESHSQLNESHTQLHESRSQLHKRHTQLHESHTQTQEGHVHVCPLCGRSSESKDTTTRAIQTEPAKMAPTPAPKPGKPKPQEMQQDSQGTVTTTDVAVPHVYVQMYKTPPRPAQSASVETHTMTPEAHDPDASPILDPVRMASLKKRHSLEVPRRPGSSPVHRTPSPTSPSRSPIRCSISPVRPVTLNSFQVPTSAGEGVNGSHTLPRAANRQGRAFGQPKLNYTGNREFRAVKKYDPEYFSASGCIQEELDLQEGDMVIQLGPVDDQGYFKADREGVIGLVPIDYVQPVSPRRQLPATPQSDGQSSQSSSRGSTPVIMGKAFRPLTPTIMHPAFARRMQKSVSPALSLTSDEGAATLPRTKKDSGRQSARPILQGSLPSPPADLQVRAWLSQDTILLAWTPPPLDEGGRNKGFLVSGYLVQVNQSRVELNCSHGLGYCVVQGLVADSSISVKTLTTAGYTSPPVTLTCTQGQNGPQSLTEEQEAVPKRVYLALYDYTPATDSSRPDWSDELTIKKGDILNLYTLQKTEGYITAMLRNKSGLVPEKYLYKVPVIQYTAKKHKKDISKRSEVKRCASYTHPQVLETQPELKGRHSVERDYSFSSEVTFV